MLRKIFAALAGALALIVTPPDLSQKETAAGDDVAFAIPLTFAWPLYTM